MNYIHLDKIVVALTISDRKSKNKPMAKKWLSRGFKKILKQDLIKYWENRIAANAADLELYKLILKKYEKTLVPVEQIKAPSAWQMLKTAATAGKNFIKSGMKFVTEEEFIAREIICKDCEFWNPKGYANTGQCLRCGCSTKAKLRLQSESCPINKWGQAIAQEHQSPKTETLGDQSTQASQ
jgi:hypothetical protein